MKTTHIHGIYKITNTLNNKFYIGSAVNLANRFACHRKDLRKNQHHNTHLQSAWNKYLESSFIFEVIEVVEDRNNLFDREQYYLDTLRPYDKGVGYNKSKSARTCLGIKFSDETKKKQSESAIKRYLKEPHPKGDKCKNFKLFDQDILDIINLYKYTDKTYSEIAIIYKVGRRYINSIILGKSRNNIPIKKESKLNEPQKSDN